MDESFVLYISTFISHETLKTLRLFGFRTDVPSFKLQPEHYSNLTAPNLQPTANQERKDQCGNQQHSCELLMIGIVMPETC